MKLNLITATAVALMAAAPAARAADTVEFTKQEAEFLAFLATKDEQRKTLTVLFAIAEVSSLPTDAKGVAEYFATQAVESQFDAPGFPETAKNLVIIHRRACVRDIQMFIMGSHEVTGKPSKKNKAFFDKLLDFYIKSK